MRRGRTAAASDALHVTTGRAKVVAMADAYKDRLDGSYNNLSKRKDIADKIDVTPEHKFVGFDAYKQAMDCLKPGDIAIFATPLAFRWVHFQYAILKGLNVFMEKPLSSDGAASRRLLKLGEEATAKNLKVGVGLMSRHARPLQEMQKRIEDGEIGDILMMRGYRMHGPVGDICVDRQAGGDQRSGFSGAAVSQLPVGRRRMLQRLQHPHHRSPVLDERRLADQGAGGGRAALQDGRRWDALCGSELRFVWD